MNSSSLVSSPINSRRVIEDFEEYGDSGIGIDCSSTWTVPLSKQFFSPTEIYAGVLSAAGVNLFDDGHERD